jgi:hypothetical protein
MATAALNAARRAGRTRTPLLRRVVRDVLLGRVLDMFLRMQLVAMRQVGVMARLFVVALLRVFRGIFVMLGRLHQMAGRFLVMICDGVRLHGHAPWGSRLTSCRRQDDVILVRQHVDPVTCTVGESAAL